MGLSDVAYTPARDLTLAYQKRIEVARALATQPEILLLDEMMAGLNPTELADAMELVKKIQKRGITIVMIEHVMKAIMGICDRIIVLDYGKKIAEGTPKEIASNKKLLKYTLEKPMLEVKKLSAGYGNIQILWDVSLKVNEGEIVALIGGNGAGKSTLVRTITGLLPANSGTMEFLGKSIERTGTA